MGEEPEAVEAVDGQEGQPEVEREAGERCEVNALLAVRLLVGPAKEGWQEGDEKYEPFYAEYDHDGLGILLDVVAEAPWALVHDV